MEAALALLLTLTILFGIMEFGRAAWSYNTVAHAAREGARFAMVHGKTSKAPATQADVQAVVYAAGDWAAPSQYASSCYLDP